MRLGVSSVTLPRESKEIQGNPTRFSRGFRSEKATSQENPNGSTGPKKEPNRPHLSAKRSLSEDPREIRLDRRKSRRRRPKAKVAIGADHTKRWLVPAKPGMGCARRIDQQIRGRSVRIGLPRDDEGFDMGAETVGDMAARFHDLVRVGAVSFACRHQQRVPGMGNEFVKSNGAARSRQGAGVPKPVSD